MKKMTVVRLLFAAIALGAAAIAPRPSRAELPAETFASNPANILDASVAKESVSPQGRLAQVYTGEQRMVSVYGSSRVKAPADISIVEVYFSSNNYDAETGQVIPLEESDLLPVMEVFENAGFSRSDMRVSITYTTSATLFLTLKQPTQSRIDSIQNIAIASVEDRPLAYQSTNNRCEIEDLSDLRKDVRLRSLEDARSRASELAGVLNAELGEVLSIIEFEVSSPFSVATCVLPENSDNPLARPQVEINGGLFVTYAMKD